MCSVYFLNSVFTPDICDRFKPLLTMKGVLSWDVTSVADDPLVRLDGLHVHSVLLLSDAKHPPAPALLPLLVGRVLLH